MIHIIDLAANDELAITQAASILNTAFSPTSWPTMESALDEVHSLIGPERLCCVAVDDEDHNAIVGLISGNSQYNGHVWELHALAVRVFRLPQAVELTMLPDYGGWKSWIELETDVSVIGALPVLGDAVFAQKLECFRAALMDYERYLQLRPRADDAAVVKGKIAELQRLAARLN